MRKREIARLRGLADASTRGRWWGDACVYRARAAHLMARMGEPKAAADLLAKGTPSVHTRLARGKYLLDAGEVAAAWRSLDAAAREARRDGYFEVLMDVRALSGRRVTGRLPPPSGMFVRALRGEQSALDGLFRRQALLTRRGAYADAWRVRRHCAIALAWLGRPRDAWTVIARCRNRVPRRMIHVQATAALIAAYDARCDADVWLKRARRMARACGFQSQYERLGNVLRELDVKGRLSRSTLSEVTEVAAILALPVERQNALFGASSGTDGPDTAPGVGKSPTGAELSSA